MNDDEDQVGGLLASLPEDDLRAIADIMDLAQRDPATAKAVIAQMMRPARHQIRVVAGDD